MANASPEEVAQAIDSLEVEMLEWLKGTRSHWNYYITCKPDDPAGASALCSIADAAEVVKISAAIQALVATRDR